LHNRVGTFLYKNEIEFINPTPIDYSNYEIHKGKLMILDNGTNKQWVILLGKNNRSNELKCITKINNDYRITNINQLLSYSETEKILPETNKNLKYDDLHIYETYYFNNIS